MRIIGLNKISIVVAKVRTIISRVNVFIFEEETFEGGGQYEVE